MTNKTHKYPGEYILLYHKINVNVKVTTSNQVLTNSSIPVILYANVCIFPRSSIFCNAHVCVMRLNLACLSFHTGR